MELAQRYGWHMVHANQSSESVHADIMHILQQQSLL